MARIAIIGAGLSGLVTANALAADHSVVVFDKSRGTGGRMATRYAGRYEFDHGAQFFTARTDAFAAECRRMLEAGVIGIWQAEFRDFRGADIVAERRWGADYRHYVGTPRMNTIGKCLDRDINLRLETEINSIRWDHGRWSLFDASDDKLGDFDWLVLALPAPQAATLVPADEGFSKRCADVEMRACYAMMLGFSKPLPISWHAAHVRDADISWISVNSSKPGRPGSECIVVHSTNAWADSNIDAPSDVVQQHLLAEFRRVSGVNPTAAEFVATHRWRYANVAPQSAEACYVDENRQLAACGDWFIHGRIEAAHSSAAAMLERLTGSL